uniref:Cap-specific mRNA (nucleoside-2'-O-)-methyltransferase 2 n=1 Tax=Clastoptera arizonana TaxID=38151 RepID=A0A1B6BY81_9HEMI
MNEQNNYSQNCREPFKRYSQVNWNGNSSYLNQFTKKFVFKEAKRSILGVKLNPNSLFQDDKWEIAEFKELKDELNTVKSQLNNLNLNEWHKHTNETNIGNLINTRIKYKISPEFLTQAWCKFAEIVSTYDLIPNVSFRTGCFNSVHLSEAPGAFITSLNHYIKSHYGFLQWKWMASSLNPYYEGNRLDELINDDRFMMHTIPNWIFGDSLTGDLMNVENMLSIVSQAQNSLQNNIMLVTADGSVDCQLDPAEQEVNIAALKYCETIAALHLLQTGGNFVLKLFTLFECETLCLINLLCNAFEAVEFFKPIKSKGGNSEVYVICLGYFGRSEIDPLLYVLKSHFGRDITKKALFKCSELKTEFLDRAYQCAEYFMKHQMMVIQFNVKTFRSFIKYDKEMIKETCQRVAQEYIPFYNLRRIPEHKMLVGKFILKESQFCNAIGSRLYDGSFSEIQKQLHTTNTVQNLRYLLKKVESLPDTWENNVECIQWECKVNLSTITTHLDVTIGKPVGKIRQSRFCQRNVLKLYFEVKALVKSEVIDNNHREVHPDHKVCDLSHHPWNTDIDEAQKQSVLDIHSLISTMEEGDTLHIVGLTLLTQFTVGLVYLLAQSFQHISFVKPTSRSSNLIFFHHKKEVCLSWLLQLTLGLKNCTDENNSVHSFVPVKHLLYLSGVRFYYAISTYNYNLLKVVMLEDIKTELSQIDVNSEESTSTKKEKTS